jgi:hypothetical protein
MSAGDACTITLGGAPVADAFALSIEIDGGEVLRTVHAVGPGVFRTRRRAGDPVFATVGAFAEGGAVAGFLERGALMLPVTLPERGWLAGTAPDGTKVEHGSPIIRYICATEAIRP